MIIETQHLPTHLALVARRVNICNPDDLASSFLETSYLVESFLKTIAVILHAGLVNSARDVAYRHAYELIIRADGLGTWEQTVREITTQPTAGYLPPEFIELIVWISRKRSKPEDEWFRSAHEKARVVLDLLGSEETEGKKSASVKELMRCFVQIRNKTKAHGAVGEDFYISANAQYLDAVVALLETCPINKWDWLSLTPRESGKVRGIALLGTDPKHIRANDVEQYTNIEQGGLYFATPQSKRVFYCGELLKANRDCTIFSVPNGGFNDEGASEFIDYASGLTSKESSRQYLTPPVPLPSSETEGLDAFDIQSNTYGNLPDISEGLIKRSSLEEKLTARLLDNHPIITLHGGGGMGKTSLASSCCGTLHSKAR